MFSFVLPITDYSSLVNSISIFLEIAGFALTIGTIRRIVRGDFVRQDFTPQDFNVERTETQVSAPNPRFYYIGIGLVAAGLFGQFLAQGIRGSW